MTYIISIVIGAVIGYITNWLAIKMLFRPHTEKRLLGFKLPFTPGLIPKERERIAKSIGETVEKHVLTKETLVEALASEKMSGHTRAWIEQKVRAMKDDNLTIKGRLQLFLGNDVDELSGKVSESILLSIKDYILMPNTRGNMTVWAKNFIKDCLSVSTEKILEGKKAIQVKEFILNKGKKIKNSEGFRGKVKAYVGEKINSLEDSQESLSDIIPEGITASLKVYLYSSRREICNYIQELSKNPSVSIRLKSAITSMINDKLSPLVAAFIKVDVVYDKLISALDDYFKEDENQRNTVMLINEAIDKLALSKVSEIMGKISDNDREVIEETVVNLIIDKIFTDNLIDRILVEVEDNLRQYLTIDEALSNLDIDYIDLITEFIIDKFYKFLGSKSFYELANSLIGRIIDNELDLNMSVLIGDKEEKVIKIVTNVWNNVFNRFLEGEALELMEALDISNIVEAKINSFDVAFAENIIISIANKELNAITWLGALLGGIIGVLSPVISKFIS